MLCTVRTTLNLDDDVLKAGPPLSRRRGKPIGVVISELIRRGLGPSQPAEVRNGIRLFPVREGTGTVTTPEVVKALLEERIEPLSLGRQHAAGLSARCSGTRSEMG